MNQNSGIYPSYNFHDFSLKNDNLGSKIKILKFLGIQPKHERTKNIFETQLELLINTW